MFVNQMLHSEISQNVLNADTIYIVLYIVYNI